jgi:protein-tyrosine-phosphatase
MAEGLMRRKLEREDCAHEFRAASSGVWTIDGRPATESAIMVMAELGIDIRSHRSRLLTDRIVENAALILTMTHSHAEAIRAEFPEHKSRVFLLSEMVGYGYDIEDPIGGSLLDYEETAQEIEALIETGYERMMQLIQQPAVGER